VLPKPERVLPLFLFMNLGALVWTVRDGLSAWKQTGRRKPDYRRPRFRGNDGLVLRLN
jgi:hypothetical protein